MISYPKTVPEVFNNSRQFYCFVIDNFKRLLFSNSLFKRISSEVSADKIFSVSEQNKIAQALERCGQSRQIETLVVKKY